jgi:hypothetical protein
VRRLLLAASLLLGACTVGPPLHFAETAAPLAKGVWRFQVAGGGGGARDVKECCGAGGLRVRVGVGRRHEVGAESSFGGGHEIFSFASKLTWKYAPIDYFALIVATGGALTTGSTGSRSPAFSFDVGLLASTPVLAQRLRVYGGARAQLAIPLDTDLGGGNGLTNALAVPIGLSIGEGPTRLFVEGGFLGAWTRYRDTNAPDGFSLFDLPGGYAALAFEYVFDPAVTAKR